MYTANDQTIEIQTKMFFSLNSYKVFTALQIQNEPTGPNVNVNSLLHLNLCLCHRDTTHVKYPLNLVFKKYGDIFH